MNTRSPLHGEPLDVEAVVLARDRHERREMRIALAVGAALDRLEERARLWAASRSTRRAARRACAAPSAPSIGMRASRWRLPSRLVVASFSATASALSRGFGLLRFTLCEPTIHSHPSATSMPSMSASSVSSAGSVSSELRPTDVCDEKASPSLREPLEAAPLVAGEPQGVAVERNRRQAGPEIDRADVQRRGIEVERDGRRHGESSGE